MDGSWEAIYDVEFPIQSLVEVLDIVDTMAVRVGEVVEVGEKVVVMEGGVGLQEPQHSVE